ncbi:MAG TPA: hypothetical protein G4O11_06115 [Anaerolineae bacterium]|nr:hypothetical protein [Anaerolineae bacterium]
MLVSKDEKVHIITRRLFDGDMRRHFVGVVEEVTDEAIRVKGYAYIYDQTSGEFARRKNKRTRIFGLTDSGLIVNVIPQTVDLDDLRYVTDESGNRIIIDGHGFEMNISEFGALR